MLFKTVNEFVHIFLDTDSFNKHTETFNEKRVMYNSSMIFMQL